MNEWLTVLLGIHEVLGLVLDMKANYPGHKFTVILLSLSWQIPVQSFKNEQRQFPTTPFQINHLQLSLPSVAVTYTW